MGGERDTREMTLEAICVSQRKGNRRDISELHKHRQI